MEFTEPQDLDLLVEYLNGFRYTEVIPLDVNRSGTSAGLLRIIVSGEEKVFALEASALGLPVCKCQRKSEPGAHEKVSHKRPRKSEPERSRIVEPVC